MTLASWIFETGFFASSQVHSALAVGAMVAPVCAAVGIFTVLRGQSFAGHALADVATTGGSAGLFLGAGPIAGFLAGGAAGAASMEAVGVQRVRQRDVATGIVLGASIGLSALFLYLTTTTSTTSGAPQRVLFGSIFVTSTGTLALVAVSGAVALAAIAVTYRPLVLCSVNTDLASARGIPARAIGTVYLIALAVAVSLSSIATGTILSTALLIGPAAAALRWTTRMGWAIVIACAVGTGSTCIGIVLAYDSAHWGSGHTSMPVSFFIVALVLAAYCLSGTRRGAHPARRAP